MNDNRENFDQKIMDQLKAIVQAHPHPTAVTISRIEPEINSVASYAVANTKALNLDPSVRSRILHSNILTLSEMLW